MSSTPFPGRRRKAAVPLAPPAKAPEQVVEMKRPILKLKKKRG